MVLVQVLVTVVLLELVLLLVPLLVGLLEETVVLVVVEALEELLKILNGLSRSRSTIMTCFVLTICKHKFPLPGFGWNENAGALTLAFTTRGNQYCQKNGTRQV